MFDDKTVIQMTATNVIHNERIPWESMMNGDQDKCLGESTVLSTGLHAFRVVKKHNSNAFAVVDENDPIAI